MKIYLASSFDLVPVVQSVADYLEARGHTIVVKWWSKDGFDMRDKKIDKTSRKFYEDPVCRLIFERDLAGVKHADAFVLVCGDTPRKFNGANVEYGIAIALGKPCYSIGALDNSAMYHPITQCKTVRGLVSHIGLVCPLCGNEMAEETLALGGGGRSFRYGFRCSDRACDLLKVVD